MKMKKIILAAALLAATASAGAQNIYDAMVFSRNTYYGTARSMALGNAMTAVGGDLGSIGINPAGSAVVSYGQFVLTPGVTISVANSAYSPEGENAYGMYNRLSHGRMNLPNIGATFNFRTGNRYGLKTISFGILSNQTNNFHYLSEGFGANSRTTMLGELAEAAYGYRESVLKEYNSFNNSDVPWDILTAYQGGMLDTYGLDDVYVGANQTISEDGSYIYLPGTQTQTSCQTKYGSKNDLILNLGMNFSDQFYLGFNIGIPSARYRYYESYYEAAVNPDDFVMDYGEEGMTRFLNASYGYQYLAEMAGVYAKIGFIYRPIDGLRLGASFQTPTAFTVSESWSYSTATNFDDSYFSDKASSPQGEYSYLMRTPYRASFGAAFTFGKKGLISVDYELADYSVMRFREVREGRLANDSFVQQNWANRYFAGVEHNIRVGAELRVTPEVTLRAGYSVMTSPERWWTSSDGQKVTVDDFNADFYSYMNHVKTLVTPHYYSDRLRTFSAGVGYSSPGSFFVDAAVRLMRYPDSTFTPYYDYASYDSYGNLAVVPSPRVLTQRSLWNVALTFGWRF